MKINTNLNKTKLSTIQNLKHYNYKNASLCSSGRSDHATAKDEKAGIVINGIDFEKNPENWEMILVLNIEVKKIKYCSVHFSPMLHFM